METGDDLPKTVNTGGTVTLPDTVNVKEGDDTIATKVTWNVEGGTAVSKSTKAAGSTYAFNVPGTYTITGTLAESSNFNPGRTFRRTIDVSCSNPISGSWKEAHWKGGSACQVSASGGA